MASSPSCPQLTRSTTSFFKSCFPTSWLVAPCRHLHASECRGFSCTQRALGHPSLHRLLSSRSAARVIEGVDTRLPATAGDTASAQQKYSSPAGHAVLAFPSLSVNASPSLSLIPASKRLFASNARTSTPPPAPPAGTSSQHLPVQAGEHAPSHEVERRHGDELKNYYQMPHEHHGDPRHHINPDGTLKFQTTSESFHWENDGAATPAQQIVSINGKKMIKGVETRDFVELFQVHQKNIPFWPRKRMSTWGNHDLLMKAEFLFFWVPTFIIWSLAVPMFTMLYMSDEAIYSTMTVKVIGRQWYWIYEIESPVDDEE